MTAHAFARFLALHRDSRRDVLLTANPAHLPAAVCDCGCAKRVGAPKPGILYSGGDPTALASALTEFGYNVEVDPSLA